MFATCKALNAIPAQCDFIILMCMIPAMLIQYVMLRQRSVHNTVL